MDDGMFLAFWHSYYLLIKNTTRHRSLLQDTGDETRLSGSSKLLYHGDKVAMRNLLVLRQVKGDGDTELWYPPAGKTSIPKLTLFYI